MSDVAIRQRSGVYEVEHEGVVKTGLTLTQALDEVLCAYHWCGALCPEHGNMREARDAAGAPSRKPERVK